jgi:hypothetical protein
MSCDRTASLTPASPTPSQALAAMYTGRLAQASPANVDLGGLLIAAEAFCYTDTADASLAPVSPAALLHSLAYAVEQHHAAALARLPTSEHQAYVQAVAQMHDTVQRDAGEAWHQVEQSISTALHRAPCAQPVDPHPLLVALYQAVRAWLCSPGHT